MDYFFTCPVCHKHRFVGYHISRTIDFVGCGDCVGVRMGFQSTVEGYVNGGYFDRRLGRPRARSSFSDFKARVGKAKKEVQSQGVPWDSNIEIFR